MKAEYSTIKNLFNAIEKDTQTALKKEILKNKTISKHCYAPCIKVNLFDYTELALIDDRLTFLDENGLHYYLYAECSLEDLIDILNKIE